MGMNRMEKTLELAHVQRREWDPTEPTAVFTRDPEGITDVEFHHTASRGPRGMSFGEKAKWLLAIERYHELTKQWSDIFYHIFVFADGEIWIGRDLRRTSQSNISDTITVHIPGNDPVLTEAQYASALKLCRLWAASPDNIRDHQGRPAATHCAGPGVRAAIARLREDFTMSADHTHTYMDLGGFKDAKDAKANGLWDGSDPAGAASRSVVAVIAQRVLNKIPAAIPGPRGPRGYAGKDGEGVTEEMVRNAVRREMVWIVAAVKAELVKDLSD